MAALSRHLASVVVVVVVVVACISNKETKRKGKLDGVAQRGAVPSFALISVVGARCIVAVVVVVVSKDSRCDEAAKRQPHNACRKTRGDFSFFCACSDALNVFALISCARARAYICSRARKLNKFASRQSGERPRATALSLRALSLSLSLARENEWRVGRQLMRLQRASWPSLRI